MIRRVRGFTLIEMILVIVLLSIIMATVAPVMMQGFKSLFSAQDLSQVYAQGQQVLTRMQRDFENILPDPSNGLTASVPSDSSIVINTSDGSSVGYELSGSDLIRKSPSTDAGYELAQGVSGLAFYFYNSSGAAASSISDARYVRVTFTTTKNARSADYEKVFYLSALSEVGA